MDVERAALPHAHQPCSKTKDTNSNYFAKWCFNLGIELKRACPRCSRCSTKADERLQVWRSLLMTRMRCASCARSRFSSYSRALLSVEAVRRMASKYELVMTSGGIGPTPDDVSETPRSRPLLC